MKLIWKSESESPALPVLEKLINILILWHGKATKMILKEMLSLEGCMQQDFHRDYVGLSVVGNALTKKEQVNTKKRRICHSRCEYPFSAMLALEDK